jgi:hypothetical protein
LGSAQIRERERWSDQVLEVDALLIYTLIKVTDRATTRAVTHDHSTFAAGVAGVAGAADTDTLSCVVMSISQ